MDAVDELLHGLGVIAGAPATIDWPSVEQQLGTALPADYKRFCQAYPSLVIDEYLVIMHPLYRSEGNNLKIVGRTILDGFRDHREYMPGSVPFPLFPERGGLLPWAFDEDGGHIFWATAGPPDEWTVVVWESGMHCEHDETFSEFLLALLRNELVCENMPKGFPGFHFEVRPLGQL